MANKFIESINSSDSSLYIRNTDYTPFYNPDDINLHDGAIRTNRGGFEYYNARDRCWFPLPGSNANIELSPHVESVLQWAFKKMQEETKLNELAKKYPAFKQAKENYETIKVLVSNE
jgi:hypothetical protein